MTTYDTETLNCLFDPIVNPSGRWQDYNPVYNHWTRLVKLAEEGQFSSDLLPAEPDPDDYPDLTSERSDIWK